MKILVVCDEWPWPPRQGDRVRLEAICRVLSESHQVTVVGRPSEAGPNPKSGIDTVALKADKSWQGLWRYPMLPAAVALRMNRGVQERIESMASNFDKVLFYQLKTTGWLPRLHTDKVVIDLTDSLGLYYRRRGGLFWELEAWRTSRWEKKLARRYPITVSSEHDQSAIDPKRSRQVTVAPNGYWIPPAISRHPEPSTVIAVGHWDYYPNRTGMLRFLDKVWPAIRGQVPDATLWLVGRGRNPLPQPHQGVRWVGEVDDVGVWYERAHLAIAPIYVGAGMKTKIMEALFYQVPVVATKFATEGIEPNAFLMASQDDEDMAQKILDEFSLERVWDAQERLHFVERNAWNQTLLPLLDLVQAGGLR